MTMAYNESHHLKRWCQWYGGQLGLENCFVIDHGSEDGSTGELPKELGRLRVPRHRPYDEATRTRSISAIASTLLNYFDAVVYSDTDEFVVADPRKHPTLRHFVASIGDQTHVTALGFNVWHRMNKEPALDPEQPILRQRHHVRPISAMCKTVLITKPITWSTGFHACNRPPWFSDLYLFHIKNADVDTCLQRYALTRAIERDERFRGGQHQLRSDALVLKDFRRTQWLPVFAWSDTAVGRLREELLSKIVITHPPQAKAQARYGFENLKGLKHLRLLEVPPEFHELF